MKKNIYPLLILMIILLAGCSKKAPMMSFIPTLAPSSDDQLTSEDSESQSGDADSGSDTSGDSVNQDEQATLTPKPVVIGETTTMYVKLDEYGAFLNVRPTPSTQGAPVGFLVHAEETEVIDIVDGWASILYKDAVCYVNADFLVEERPAYLDPPTPTPKPAATPTPVPGEAPPEI